MTDRFQLTSSSLPDDARLVSFRCHEALSEPYEIEVVFVVPDAAHFDMADMIGAKATVRGAGADGEPDAFVRHGVVASVKLLVTVGESGLFAATVTPRFAQLALTHRSRLFTKLALPDVIREVFSAAGLVESDFELALDERYETEEHVCQYQESDLELVQRWLEREGLYYFFRHEEDQEKLVVVDHRAIHERPSRAVRYRPGTSRDESAGESLDAFACKHVVLPASVTMRDYDYANPSLEVVGTAAVSRTGVGDMNYHAARVFTPDRSKRLAKIRAEELTARRVTFEGSGTFLHLLPGHCFKLEEHPMFSGHELLVTRAVHEGNQGGSSSELMRLAGVHQDDVYRSRFEAIERNVQFRTPRRTPWPRVYGYEGGVVDGPTDSEYAQIDDQGRYLIKMKFDESDLKDGKASTWIRMMQPHGGGVEGWHFPLRKGTEVVISFLGGDPDRPVISGVVPNAHTPSPVTSTNNTANIIQTGGRNRIELEDREGSQRFTMYSPTQETMIRLGAPNDEAHMKFTTDGNHNMKVGGETRDDRDGPVAFNWNDSFYFMVSGPITEFFESGVETTIVEKDWKIHLKDGSFMLDTSAALLVDVGTNASIAADLEYKVKVGDNDWLLVVDKADIRERHKGSRTFEIDNDNKETFGSLTTKTTKGGIRFVSEKTFRASALEDIFLETKAGLNLSAVGDLAITCNDQNVDTLGNNQNINGGATYSLFGGLKYEASISGSISVSASLSMAFSGGLKVDLFAGPSIGTKTTEVKFCNIEVSDITSWIRSSIFNFQSSVLTIL